MKTPEILSRNPALGKFLAEVILVVSAVYLAIDYPTNLPHSYTDAIRSNYDILLSGIQRTNRSVPPDGVLIAPIKAWTIASFHRSHSGERVKWAKQVFESKELGPDQTPYQPR